MSTLLCAQVPVRAPEPAEAHALTFWQTNDLYGYMRWRCAGLGETKLTRQNLKKLRVNLFRVLVEAL